MDRRTLLARIKDNWPLINTIVLTITLIFIAKQSCSIARNTQLLESDYEARNRPYLVFSDVKEQLVENDSVYLDIEVINRGDVPATNVFLDRLIIGGGELSYRSDGQYIFSYLSTEGYITSLEVQNLPRDLVFFPEESMVFPAEVHRGTYEGSVIETGKWLIALEYSWGERHYVYIGEGTVNADGTWSIEYHRDVKTN